MNNFSRSAFFILIIPRSCLSTTVKLLDFIIQEIKIILIAAPAIQQSAIIERAKLLQIQKLTSEKALVALKPQRTKSKSPKRKNKSKPSPEKPSKISQSDLYEAEKDIWRHLKACTIQANIRCTLEYDAEEYVYCDCKGAFTTKQCLCVLVVKIYWHVQQYAQ